MNVSTALRAAVATAAAGLALAVPASAHAAGQVPSGRSTMTIDCAGLGSVTIVSPPSVTGDTWGAAQIIGDGHLVPVSFRFYAYDETLGLVLGDYTVSHGAAHGQQSTTTCDATQTALLGELAPPDEPLPPGVSPSDVVSSTFEVVAVVQR
jgi:hypothetical protein